MQARHFFCFARGVIIISGVRLASRGFRMFVLYFNSQIRDFLPCKERDLPLWHRSGVPWSTPLYFILSGRCATFCSVRGVMYVSGVALVSRELRRSAIYFTWQVRDVLLCKGHDRRLWRPSSIPLASRGLRIAVLYLAW